MPSINSIPHIPTFMMTSNDGPLKQSTIERLLALGIDPTTVTTEAQAQNLIAQAEAAKNENNNPEQEEGGKQQEKHKAELIQQNIYNTMDMISTSNKLILGL